MNQARARVREKYQNHPLLRDLHALHNMFGEVEWEEEREGVEGEGEEGMLMLD